MKIGPVGAESFHADGRTNDRRGNANSRFSRILRTRLKAHPVSQMFFRRCWKNSLSTITFFILESNLNSTYCTASNLRIICGQKGERDVERRCLAYFKMY